VYQYTSAEYVHELLNYTNTGVFPYVPCQMTSASEREKSWKTSRKVEEKP